MDAIDYSIAGRWADVVHALAIVESSENPSAIGDHGRAFGLLQQHPAFFYQYYGKVAAFRAEVSDTWIVAQIKCAASFFELYDHLGFDLVVQAYNQGVAVFSRPEVRAPEYLEKFTAALNRVRGLNNAKAELSRRGSAATPEPQPRGGEGDHK